MSELTYRIENKDCMDFLSTVEDNSVDYINVDPPYNIGYDGGDGWDTFESEDAYLQWCDTWIRECYRVLKPGGIFLAHTPAYPMQEAFQDPSHVNIISENTIEYFAGHSIETCRNYGFKGTFEIIRQEWSKDFTYWLIWEIRKSDILNENFGDNLI